jgi:hypothetical protein
MAMVDDFLEMRQGNQNLHAILKESHAQNKQMTAITNISHKEKIFKVSWSLFQHDGMAAFELSDWSPLPPAVSTKYVPGNQTEILIVCRIGRINCHWVESGEDSAPEFCSDMEDWLNCNGDLDNPNDSEDDCMADVESDIEQGNAIDDPECPAQRDVTTVPNVPRFIRPIQKSQRWAE